MSEGVWKEFPGGLNLTPTLTLARIGGGGKKFEEALTHYHAALALNKNFEQAQVGLERLQKVIKGIDPDAEEEEEGDDEEAEEESFGDEET